MARRLYDIKRPAKLVDDQFERSLDRISNLADMSNSPEVRRNKASQIASNIADEVQKQPQAKQREAMVFALYKINGW